MELCVVAGVHDADDLARIDDRLKPGEHPGGADPAAEDRYHKAVRRTWFTTEATPLSSAVQGFHPRCRPARLGSSALRCTSPALAGAGRGARLLPHAFATDS